MAQRHSITITVPEHIKKALEVIAAREFDKPSTIAAERLIATFANEGFQAPPKSESALMRERKEQLDLNRAELEHAKAVREVIPIDMVLERMNRDFMVVRSRMLAIEHELTALTDKQREQVREALNDAFKDLSNRAEIMARYRRDGTI